MLVLGHGAGANMEHAFMEELAQRLAANGVGTLRYNFPYMEKGGGPPDRPKVAYPTVAAAVKKAASLANGRKPLAGGKSFGGRMTSHVAAEGGLGPSAARRGEEGLLGAAPQPPCFAQRYCQFSKVTK